MDFAYHYTESQETFRREISAWLDTVLPGDVEGIRDSGSAGLRAHEDFRRELGARGWLAPLDSREQGGAGLSPDENVVLLEELNRRGVLFFLQDAAMAVRSAVLKWGSEDQKSRLVTGLAKGRVEVWRQRYIEGDPLELIAAPDADGYIVTGQAIFSGRGPSPSWLWTLAMVDSDSPGEPAAASFLVSPSLDGVRIATRRTLSDHTVRRVFFDRVWVPRSEVLGDDGVAVMQAGASRLQGADLRTPLETETNALVEYARDTTSHGAPLSAEPVRQQLLVEAYIASRVMRLLRMRAGWVDESDGGEGHEGAEAVLWEERASRHLSQIVQRVVGVYALLDDSDPKAVADGRFERLIRGELAARGEITGSGATEHLIATALGLAEAADPTGDRAHRGERDDR